MSAAVWSLETNTPPPAAPAGDGQGSVTPAAPAGRALSWEPSRETGRRMLGWFAVGGAAIGVVGFAVSFASVMNAAAPYLGWACWTLPVLVDLAIFVLSGVSLLLELHEISSRWIRLIPTALAGFTVYLNTATQHSVFGKAVHAAGPLLWVAVVEIGTHVVRRLVGLTSESRMDKVRAARWLLAPVSTFRLWRRMRLWEITSYRAAVKREHDLTASRALLRQWYGRAWRSKAPRGERLAVALQASSERPVADVLAEASAGILAAAAAAKRPDTEARDSASEKAPETAPIDPALRPLDPIVYPRETRPGLLFTEPFTPQVTPFTDAKTLTLVPSTDDTEDDAAAARRMRADGASLAQIAAALGYSKTWAHNATTGARPVEQVNGHAA